MSRRRVLYVANGHPSLQPGGTEICSADLHAAVGRGGAFESFLVARASPLKGAPEERERRIVPMPGDDHQYLFLVARGENDAFDLRAADKGVAESFGGLLEALRPDVVHFQHTHGLGLELVREARNCLPKAPIMYSLHEFLAICPRDGHMVRARSNELCEAAAPHLCHACFPDRTRRDFVLRERWVRAHMALVDRFITPSEFLRRRFIEWGLPAASVLTAENGRDLPAPPTTVVDARPRSRFGFFGQLIEAKGPDLLLRAMSLLAGRPEAAGLELSIYGNRLDEWPALSAELTRAAESGRPVFYHGAYRNSDVVRLMSELDWVVVPSTWWENSPLVIQEAFRARRPVICSDIGGMAEKVLDGVNGLHFRARDPVSLANTMARALNTPGLWKKLADGISEPVSADAAARTMVALYDEVLAEPARAPG